MSIFNIMFGKAFLYHCNRNEPCSDFVPGIWVVIISECLTYLAVGVTWTDTKWRPALQGDLRPVWPKSAGFTSGLKSILKCCHPPIFHNMSTVSADGITNSYYMISDQLQHSTSQHVNRFKQEISRNPIGFHYSKYFFFKCWRKFNDTISKKGRNWAMGPMYCTHVTFGVM